MTLAVWTHSSRTRFLLFFQNPKVLIFTFFALSHTFSRSILTDEYTPVLDKILDRVFKQ